MFHVVFTSLLLLLTVKDVICQSHADFGGGPELSGCMLDCPRGFVPGTCLCQYDPFPFLFPATPCKFANCPQGKLCQMDAGKAVCVTLVSKKPTVDVCSLPADPGPCEALDRRFFFDQVDGTCKPFNYGGCQGNGNRFDSKLRCERACIANVPAVGILRKESAGISAIPSSISKQNEICLLPVKLGPCLGHIPSFFFNSTRGRCQGFIYGGCSGNQNRFASLRACQVACLGAAPVAGPLSSANDDCNLPKETGYCRAHMPSFFYNKNTGECESFVYGGCGGNANRFDSRSDCELHCKPPGSGPEFQPTAERPRFSTNENCNLPKLVGPCKAYMPSFFYNTGTGQCERFVYGGCGGNANRFETRQECEGKCQRIIYISSAVQSQNPACLLPKVVGPCRARMPRYFFHQSSQTCELFYYGGCGGNSNNFRTLEGCEGACVSSETVQDVCALPKVTGPCFAAFPRFYFDKTAGRCKTFTYGGCHGNQNNFRSLRACRNTCPGN